MIEKIVEEHLRGDFLNEINIKLVALGKSPITLFDVNGQLIVDVYGGAVAYTSRKVTCESDDFTDEIVESFLQIDYRFALLKSIETVRYIEAETLKRKTDVIFRIIFG